MKLLTKSFQMLAAGVLLAVAFTACTKASERITDAEGDLVEVCIYAGGVQRQRICGECARVQH